MRFPRWWYLWGWFFMWRRVEQNRGVFLRSSGDIQTTEWQARMYTRRRLYTWSTYIENLCESPDFVNFIFQGYPTNGRFAPTNETRNAVSPIGSVSLCRICETWIKNSSKGLPAEWPCLFRRFWQIVRCHQTVWFAPSDVWGPRLWPWRILNFPPTRHMFLPVWEANSGRRHLCFPFTTPHPHTQTYVPSVKLSIGNGWSPALF